MEAAVSSLAFRDLTCTAHEPTDAVVEHDVFRIGAQQFLELARRELPTFDLFGEGDKVRNLVSSNMAQAEADTLVPCLKVSRIPAKTLREVKKGSWRISPSLRLAFSSVMLIALPNRSTKVWQV